VAKIAILTGIHLCHNPRVMKEATAFAKAGHDVLVLGGWIDPVLREQDRELMKTIPYAYKSVFDMSANLPIRLGARMRAKLSGLAHRCGHESRWQLGYAYPALRRSAFRHEADLYIAHSEQAMAVGVDLMRAGARVGVDMEDWFSEDLPPGARSYKPLNLLRQLESTLLRRGALAICPSAAMSAALANAYGGREPIVVYNAFPRFERQSVDGRRKDRRNPAIPSICWHSQTIGPGRGIEDLAAALPLLQSEAEVHLRGRTAPGMESWIRHRIPERWQERVLFHPLVQNEELLSRIAEHDIGLAGEMQHCRSRDLTVTNKILHYLLGGLAVVASDTAGQREVAAAAGEAVLLYPPGQHAALAAQINKLLSSPDALSRAKAASLKAAEQTFCWERQAPKLDAAVANALAK
jgi:glycosyltransferase involved in cell wall biosynthesis